MAVRFSFTVNGRHVSAGAGRIKESSEAQVRTVTTKKIHHNYNLPKNDIALLKTEEQFQKLYFTGTVILSSGIRELENTLCFQVGKVCVLITTGHFFFTKVPK